MEMIWFMVGFMCGILVTGMAVVNMTKTYDLTILAGKMKWIKREDRFELTYDQLKEKYIK